MRTCKKCSEKKEVTAFYKSKRDGISYKCLACHYKNKTPKTREQSREDQRKYRQGHKEKTGTYNRNYFDSIHGRFKRYQYDSQRYSRRFNLTFEQFSEIVVRPCEYCGSEKSLGVDRVDSSIGYEIENCVPCCRICNVMKNSLSVEDFLDHIKKIFEKVTAG